MKDKKDAFFSLYGGAGKSSLATEFALTLDRQLITNQSVASPLPLVFDENNLLVLDDPAQDMPNLPDEADIIFDLGGFADHRVISALKQSNNVLIPCAPNTNRVNGLLETINEVMKYNENIIVIANPSKKSEDCDIIRAAINDTFGDKFKNIPVYPVRFSEGIPNIFNTGKSIHQTANENTLLAWSYRTIIEQLDEIIKIIK